jgi:hypothetical protein
LVVVTAALLFDLIIRRAADLQFARGADVPKLARPLDGLYFTFQIARIKDSKAGHPGSMIDSTSQSMKRQIRMQIVNSWPTRLR